MMETSEYYGIQSTNCIETYLLLNYLDILMDELTHIKVGVREYSYALYPESVSIRPENANDRKNDYINFVIKLKNVYVDFLPEYNIDDLIKMTGKYHNYNEIVDVIIKHKIYIKSQSKYKL